MTGLHIVSLRYRQGDETDTETETEMDSNKTKEHTASHGKKRRNKIKKERFKTKKKEAKQQALLSSSSSPQSPSSSSSPPPLLSRDNSASSTITTDLIRDKSVPTSHFTFRTSLTESSVSTSASSQTVSQYSSNRNACNIDEGRDSLESKAVSEPNLYAHSSTSSLSPSGSYHDEPNGVDHHRSSTVYCHEQGDAHFATHLSPLSSYESLLLSSDTTQASIIERYPIAGRCGAFSAPSTPVYDKSFWQSDDSSTGSKSLSTFGMGGEEEEKASKWIRRAYSMNFIRSDWNQDWAFESYHSQGVAKKENGNEAVHSMNSLGLHTVKSTQDLLPLISSIASSDNSRVIVTSQHGEEGAELTGNSNEAEVHADPDDEDISNLCEEHMVCFQRKKFNVLYTSSSEPLKSMLKKIFRKGSQFFMLFGVHGEVQNKDGQYTLISNEQIVERLSELSVNSTKWERTIWTIDPVTFGALLTTVSNESYEEQQRRLARVHHEKEAHTLSPALQQVRERLERSAEQSHAKREANKKITIAGGKDVKWASIRRRYNKNKSHPKKIESLLLKEDKVAKVFVD